MRGRLTKRQLRAVHAKRRKSTSGIFSPSNRKTIPVRLKTFEKEYDLKVKQLRRELFKTTDRKTKPLKFTFPRSIA